MFKDNLQQADLTEAQIMHATVLTPHCLNVCIIKKTYFAENIVVIFNTY